MKNIQRTIKVQIGEMAGQARRPAPIKIEVVTVYLTSGGNWTMIFVTTSSMSRCICREVS